MSHNPYNPYSSGNQNPTQGQYGLPNTQTERDPRRGSSFLGHGSIPSSAGAHYGIPENSGGMTSSSLNYRCDSSRMMRDEGANHSMDMHVGKAREEARLPVNPMHRHMEQDSPFTRIQRDEFHSSGTGMTSYPMASAPSMHQAVTQSGNTKFNWLANCAGPSSGTKSTPALSNFARGDGGLFDTSSEGQNKMQAIPGLGDFQYPASGRSEVSAEPKYTSESAASILQRFGLEKGDLEHLISYPEDQITPANLPFILRKIRLEKDKKTTAGFQPTQTVTGPDSYSLGKASEMRIEETSSSVLQPSKVIDYGHTGKYTVGAGGDIGRKSDKDNTGGSRSVFLTDAAANRPNPEPLQKKTTDVKSSALGSSREQGSPFPSSSYGPASSSAAFPGKDQTQQLLTQPSPTYQNILSSFSFPKKDTAMGGLTSNAPKPIPVKQPESDRQVTKVPVSSTSSHCRHPSRPGLVLIGSNDTSDTKDSSKTKGKMSAPTEHTKQQGKQKEQTKQQPMKQQQKTLPAKSAPKQPSREQQSKQPQKKPVPQTRKVVPPTFGKSALPSAGISNQTKQLTSKKQQKDKLAATGDQPTPSMMFDYSATAPRVYPHTCSLCNKECTNMQVSKRLPPGVSSFWKMWLFNMKNCCPIRMLYDLIFHRHFLNGLNSVWSL